MIRQPAPKPDVMARRDSIVAGLRALLPESGLIAEPLRLKPYETDGLSAYRQVPLAVALPETTEQVAAVLRYCHQNGVRVIPRGAGTSLSGGALPMEDAVVVGMMRMNQILDIDYPDRCAVVQAGVTNIGITNAVSADGFFYAPDPSSQLACMIGGNVNMNSGGAHCLKYGVTANNLLGLKIVTIDGDIIDIGGAHLDAAGYDWLGLLTGSEGMLAVVTEVTVRILRGPEGARAMLAAFKSNEIAGACGRCDHLLRHHPGGAGIHGPAGDPCLRGVRPCRLSARRRGDADHRGRRQRRGTGPPAGPAVRDLQPVRPDQPEGFAVGGGIAGDLEGPQGRVRRRRPDQPGLPVHGRHHPDQPVAAGAAPDPGDVGQLRPEGRQHLPCRRRQPASADHVRRQRPGQLPRRGDIRRRHPEAVRRGRRLPDRRARGRRGKARPDAGAVPPARTAAAARSEIGLRPRLAAEPQQGVPVARAGRRSGMPHDAA